MDNSTDPRLPRPISEGKAEPPAPEPVTSHEPIPSEFGEDEPDHEDEPAAGDATEPPAEPTPPEPDATIPPVLPSEPPPPSTAPTAPAEAPAKSGCPWGWLLACGLGCGAMVVALIITLLVMSYLAVKSEQSQSDTGTVIDSGDAAEGEYEQPAAPNVESGAVPEIYKPGEQVAKEAALVDYPDWVARVQSHSPDWTEAVVWIGPPQSEFVWEYKLQWHTEGSYYNVVSMDAVEPVGGF